jgi:hypothetical protein
MRPCARTGRDVRPGRGHDTACVLTFARPDFRRHPRWAVRPNPARGGRRLPRHVGFMGLAWIDLVSSAESEVALAAFRAGIPLPPQRPKGSRCRSAQWLWNFERATNRRAAWRAGGAVDRAATADTFAHEEIGVIGGPCARWRDALGWPGQARASELFRGNGRSRGVAAVVGRWRRANPLSARTMVAT